MKKIKGHWARGEDLWGDWGDGPPTKFEMGGRPMHWSSPIFWKVVLSDGRESTDRVKNSSRHSRQGFFSEIVVFLVKKGSYTPFYTVKIRSSEFSGMKMEIFFRKDVIEKFWSAKNFSVPQNSAPGLRHCIEHTLNINQFEKYLGDFSSTKLEHFWGHHAVSYFKNWKLGPP